MVIFKPLLLFISRAKKDIFFIFTYNKAFSDKPGLCVFSTNMYPSLNYKERNFLSKGKLESQMGAVCYCFWLVFIIPFYTLFLKPFSYNLEHVQQILLEIKQI